LYQQWPVAAPKEMFLVPDFGHCDVYIDSKWFGCSPYVTNWCSTDVDCSLRLQPGQYCNTSSNGGASTYNKQKKACNTTFGPCWSQLDRGTIWSYTMYFESYKVFFFFFFN